MSKLTPGNINCSIFRINGYCRALINALGILLFLCYGEGTRHRCRRQNHIVTPIHTTIIRVFNMNLTHQVVYSIWGKQTVNNVHVAKRITISRNIDSHPGFIYEKGLISLLDDARPFVDNRIFPLLIIEVSVTSNKKSTISILFSDWIPLKSNAADVELAVDPSTNNRICCNIV